MKKYIAPFLLVFLLAGCGGGSSNSGTSTHSGGPGSAPFSTAASGHCAAPRAANILDQNNQPFGDVQGSLPDEMAWIASFVNTTYLWYPDVPAVSAAPYTIGATVPYVDPANNATSTETLTSNHDVVDAYFNAQRSPLLTASGKPKDQFHFTYLTSYWQQLTSAGNVSGFGFQAAQIPNATQIQIEVAYTSPGTPAALHGLVRGTRFIRINNVDVATASSQADLNILDEALYSPVANTSYTFVVQIPGQPSQSTIILQPVSITLTPVTIVGTLPAPNASVGYILYTDQIATAESELIAAVTQLQQANNSAGITDLVLDLRYNGGGYLDIASELAYMIAGPVITSGKFFEQDTYNSKNPFGLTLSQDTVPFHSTTQGFSTADTLTPLPSLNLSTVYVITSAGTCSASEAIMNGLIGAGVKVVQVGSTTCGKPYGFYPQDNCSTTYFAIQFEGVNYLGFGAYADGFVPGGTGSTANNLPGCAANDDLAHQLGDPAEASLATALYYRNNGGACPSPALGLGSAKRGNPALLRSQARENRILRRGLNR